LSVKFSVDDILIDKKITRYFAEHKK